MKERVSLSFFLRLASAADRSLIGQSNESSKEKSENRTEADFLCYKSFFVLIVLLRKKEFCKN